APELNDVIAVSPHTKRVMASGEALVIALFVHQERGFELIEQLPCLKLNRHSITPENDLLRRLYKPTRGVRI
ncbi:hypothetical protein, partial [Pseudomonas brenneri]|uniref:hypothetical protein n=1 Tax=Pseudomonas brenneri TaxID=129817 RepID=UPI0028D2DD91